MELWDIYDKNGNLTGRTKRKGNPFSKNEYHLAMEAWILNSKAQLLIQRRSEKCEILPGIWAHTTGRMTAGENSLTGCVREIDEELGIKVKKEDIRFIRRIIRDDDTNIIWDVYIIKKDINLADVKLQENEVSKVKWVSIEEIRKMLKTREFFEYPEIYEIISYIENISFVE